MLKSCGELYLAMKPVLIDRGGQLRIQNLEHHFSVESRVLRDKNARHAAPAQLAFHAVRGAE
jgi:hypothetical protein